MNERSWIKFLALSSFIVLAVLPIAYMYLDNYSFTRYTWITKDVRQQNIFISTIWLGLGTVLLSLFLGVACAVILECTDLPLKSILAVLIIIPLLIPPYITSISWLAAVGKADLMAKTQSTEPYSENTSVIRINKDVNNAKIMQMQKNNTASPATSAGMAKRFSLFPFEIDPFRIEFAVLMLSLSLFPLVFLITSSALKNVDARLEEAALLISPPRDVLRKITLPLIYPHIIVSGLFVFIFAISELGVPSILQVHTLTMEIFNHFVGFFDPGQALGLSVPLVVSTALLIAAAQLVLGKRPFMNLPAQPKKELMNLSPVQKALGLLFILSLLILSAGIPLYALLMQSNLMFLESLTKAWDSVLNSIFLGILCSTIILFPSFFVAYFSKKKMDYLILLPLTVPSAALGIGMIYIWNNNVTALVYESFLILLFGYMARFLPFTIKSLAPFIEQIPESLDEAGRLAGASYKRIAWEILMPLAKPGLITAWLVGFILCMRELEISVFLTPPGFQTLPNRVFTLYHYGDIQTTASLSLILVALIIVPYLVLITINKTSKWLTCRSRN